MRTSWRTCASSGRASSRAPSSEAASRRGDAFHAPRCGEAPDVPPFTLQQLAALCAVVRCGGFVRGARALGTSQPTATRAVKALEAAVGCPLFDAPPSASLVEAPTSPNRRGRRPLRLTEAGKLLHEYSERILDLASESTAALHDLHHMETGRIRLGASQTTGTYLMPKLIGTFHREYPQVSVALEVDSTRRVCADVARGALDVAVVGGDVPRELESGLVITPYAEDEFALIVSTSHPLAKKKRAIEKRELYDLDFVAPLECSTIATVQNRTLEFNRINTERLNIVLEFNSIEAIKSAVQFDLGVAFVSTLSIQKELRLGLLQRVHVKDLRLTRSLRVITSKERFTSRAAKRFCREFLFQSKEKSWEDGLFEEEESVQEIPRKTHEVKETSAEMSRIEDLYKTTEAENVASLGEIEDILLGDSKPRGEKKH